MIRQVAQDGPSASGDGNLANCPRPGERVENDAALRAAGDDAAPGQLLREGGEVSARVWLRGDGPDRAGVTRFGRILRPPRVEAGIAPLAERVLFLSWVWCARRVAGVVPSGWPEWSCGLRNRRRVVEVPFRLRQKEHVLVRARRSVLNTFRHRVGLGPYDVRAEPPPICLE